MKPLWLLLGVCAAKLALRTSASISGKSDSSPFSAPFSDPLVGAPSGTDSSLIGSIGSSVASYTGPAAGWIEQFNNYLGTPTVFSASATPVLLNSKVTNYRYNHNGADLRAWTKYLVESHKAQAVATKLPAPEFDIDAFIEYLVRHKHFREKDLQFLRRPGLDYGHDQIERELTKIKQKQEEEESKTIDIGGETIEGSALSVRYSYHAIVAFAVFLML